MSKRPTTRQPTYRSEIEELRNELRSVRAELNRTRSSGASLRTAEVSFGYWQYQQTDDNATSSPYLVTDLSPDITKVTFASNLAASINTTIALDINSVESMTFVVPAGATSYVEESLLIPVEEGDLIRFRIPKPSSGMKGIRYTVTLTGVD